MNTAYFLINTIFDLYLMVVLLRVWLQWARADFYNPMSQMVVKLTNPLVVPLRRVIPGFAGWTWPLCCWQSSSPSPSWRCSRA